MPIQPTHPGVYIEEIPSGVRTIAGVATSITAFVGRTSRGSITDPIRCDSWGDFERQCGGMRADSELTYSVAQFFLNGGGTAIISRVEDGGTPATLTTGGLTLRARDPGEWGSGIRVTIGHGTDGEVDATPDTNTFHLTLDEIDVDEFADSGNYEQSLISREEYPSVSVVAGSAREVQALLEARSRLVRVTGTLPGTRPGEVDRQPLAGGGDGTAAGASDANHTAAIQRLGRADVVNLVIIPAPSRTADTPLSVLTTASQWCTDNRAMLIVEPPAAWSTVAAAAAATGLDSLRSPNTIFYFPRITAADSLQENAVRPMGPGGAIAGVIASIDGDRGVWKAPAGQDARLRGTAGFEHYLTEADIGVINERGVNALRSLPAVGQVIWGARTARGADTMASEWKYVPVRRLALFIEESLFRGTQWAVFEPNDEPLWGQMRLAVGNFMNSLFRAGAFAGATERDAYQVVCDSSTTTQNDIDRGVVNVLVGFAPLKPAEFIVLSFQQLAGRAS